jgi:hypothetical protein
MLLYIAGHNDLVRLSARHLIQNKGFASMSFETPFIYGATSVFGLEEYVQDKFDSRWGITHHQMSQKLKGCMIDEFGESFILRRFMESYMPIADACDVVVDGCGSTLEREAIKSLGGVVVGIQDGIIRPDDFDHVIDAQTLFACKTFLDSLESLYG